MTFMVNGQGQTWAREDVKDDMVFPLGKYFPNIDLDKNQTITITVTGYEEDSLSANDVLPSLKLTLHPAQDFALGGTFWSDIASSDEGSYSIEYTVIPAVDQPLSVARQYVGGYHGGNGPYGLWCTDWNNFLKKWQEWSSQGMRLQRLSTFRVDTGVASFGDTTQRLFAGIFGPGNDGYALWSSDWPSFEAKWKELSAQGLRLVDIACFKDGGKPGFAGVYRQGTEGYALWVSPWPAFETKWKELSNSGLRLIALDTYRDGNTRMFAGVYRAGTDAHALWVGVPWDAFLKKWKEFRNSGLDLIDVASYAEGGQQLFAGVFRKSAAGSTTKNVLAVNDWQGFTQDWSIRSNNGMRLACLESFVAGTDE
jgi:hypothetical protein